MKSILTGILLLGLVTSANAAIINNGTYTTDTASGLDWLDLTETQGMSYNSVLAQLGSGGAFAGYEYAAASQVNTLVSNYTGRASIINGLNYFSEGAESIDGLIQLLGNTYVGNPTNDLSLVNYSSGITREVRTTTGQQYTAKLYDFEETSTSLDITSAYNGAVARNDSFVFIGSFLVRNSAVPTPEATSLLLFTLGMLGLFGVTRRKV